MSAVAEMQEAVQSATADSLLPGDFLKLTGSAPVGSGDSGHKDATETLEEAVTPAQGYMRRISLPIHRQKSRYLQEKVWLGMVVKLEGGGFTARLKDYEGGPDLVTDFDFQEIAPEDVELAKVGSEFYWSLGYCDEPNGQRQRYSWIRFRRLPKWTANALQQAKNRAQELLVELLEESDGSS